MVWISWGNSVLQDTVEEMSFFELYHQMYDQFSDKDQYTENRFRFIAQSFRGSIRTDPFSDAGHLVGRKPGGEIHL